jgi:hypothetical protein
MKDRCVKKRKPNSANKGKPMPIPGELFPAIRLGLVKPNGLHQPFAAKPQHKHGSSDQHDRLIYAKR